jgi:fatty-acid peroxygenase
MTTSRHRRCAFAGVEPGYTRRMVTPPVLDQTAAMLAKGYRYGTDRRGGTDLLAFRTRVLGRSAVCAIGAEAVRKLYDPTLFERHGTLPRPIQKTLTGLDALHTLDGVAHRNRKAMMLPAARDGLADLPTYAAMAWNDAVSRWRTAGEVVLFDEVAQVLTEAACAAAGVPLPADEAPSRADDMVAMIDGFATVSRRHLRARRARKRSEVWLQRVIEAVRRGQQPADSDAALAAVAHHRDEEGRLLPPRVAAVEMLNLIRPAVAVAWFVTFGAEAMHNARSSRERLAEGDPHYLGAFVQELRRHYPFAPYIGGRAVVDVDLRDLVVPRGHLLLIDVYGHHHDQRLWADPYRFRPERFETASIGEHDLIPQGSGDPSTGHRCPGEPATIAVLETLLPRLAAFAHDTPPQNMAIPLRRIPARVASGYVMTPTRRRLDENGDGADEPGIERRPSGDHSRGKASISQNGSQG